MLRIPIKGFLLLNTFFIILLIFIHHTMILLYKTRSLHNLNNIMFLIRIYLELRK